MVELKLLSEKIKRTPPLQYLPPWFMLIEWNQCVRFYSPNQNKILELILIILILKVNIESTPGKQILNVNSSSSIMKNSNVQCLSINECSCIWDGSRKLLRKDALAKLLKEFKQKKKEEEREWVQDCEQAMLQEVHTNLFNSSKYIIAFNLKKIIIISSKGYFTHFTFFPPPLLQASVPGARDIRAPQPREAMGGRCCNVLSRPSEDGAALDSSGSPTDPWARVQI